MENNLVIEILQRVFALQQEMQTQQLILSTQVNQLLTQFPLVTNEFMTRQEVKDYLGISEATYKRKVKDGSLRPIKMPGGDRFYKRELGSAFEESKLRGRI